VTERAEVLAREIESFRAEWTKAKGHFRGLIATTLLLWAIKLERRAQKISHPHWLKYQVMRLETLGKE